MKILTVAYIFLSRLRFPPSLSNKRRYSTQRIVFIVHVILAVSILIVVLQICKNCSCNPKIRNHLCDITSQVYQNTLSKKANSQRYSDIMKRLRLQQRNGSFRNGTSGHSPDVVIGIVTVERPYPSGEESWHYLTQTAGTIVNLLAEQKQSNLTFRPFICNANPAGEILPEIRDLQPFIKLINVYDDTAIINEDRFGKEKEDYVFCLEASVRLWPSASYALILEDDALPNEDLFQELRSILSYLKFRRSKLSRSKVGLVKLYHPEQWRKIPWLFYSFAASFSISIFTCYILHCIYANKTSFPFSHCRVIFFYWILYSLMFYSIGHSNMAIMRKVLTSQTYLGTAESCCTPAVLYPTESLGKIVDFLKSSQTNQDYSKDHVIDKIPSSLFLDALQTDVNLVSHIGRYSTLRTTLAQVDS